MDDSPKPSKMIKSGSSASKDSQKPPKYGSTSATPNSKINTTRSTIFTPNAKINKSLSSQSPQVQEESPFTKFCNAMSPLKPCNVTQGYNIEVSDPSLVFKSPPKDRFCLQWELRHLESLDDETKELVPTPEWYPKHFGIKNHTNTHQDRSPTPSTPSVSAYLVDPSIDQMYSLKSVETDASIKSKEVRERTDVASKVHGKPLIWRVYVRKNKKKKKKESYVASKVHGKPPLWRVYVRKNKKKENDDVVEGVTCA